MEKYLKMPAGFDGGAEWFGNAMKDDMTASDVIIDAAVHAINSHDELVAMNKELLDALEKSVELTDHFGSAYGCDPSNYIEYKMAVNAIAKAKATS